MKRVGIDGVLGRVVRRLSAAGYRKRYTDETAFELDVWPRVTALAEQMGFDCLTSHAVHSDRSVEKWEQFSREVRGSDVGVLGAKNRLDIVLRRGSLFIVIYRSILRI
jgi:hypothetical protein